MVTEGILHRRMNGVFYTSTTLARCLVRPLIEDSTIYTVFDPAYGDGSLIIEAESILKEKGLKDNEYSLFGCDIDPKNGRISHLPKKNFRRLDYFDYPTDQKFDCIVMNPPFVRHHNMKNDLVEKYRNILAQAMRVPRTADLWTYFTVKSLLHLNIDGCFGAILPWSFIQADYAKHIRLSLIDKFETIKILVLGAGLFEDTDERVVLLWLNKYGRKTKSIKVGYSHNFYNLAGFEDISNTQFIGDKVIVARDIDLVGIIDRFKKCYGFEEFQKHADVSIGVVTGADSYFILDEAEAELHGFKKEHLVPIITSSRFFNGLSINGHCPDNRLIYIDREDFKKYRHYLRKGIVFGYNLRAHARQRDPWYKVRLGKYPDAFFPYRVSSIPYLVINDSQKMQCTNSIHRIYFRNLSLNEIKMIQVSLLSVAGQLSLEINSKVYGSGMLKVEPSSLKRAIVIRKNGCDIDRPYEKICKLIGSGKRTEAMMAASEYINDKFAIDRNLHENALSALKELQDRRLRRGARKKVIHCA